MAFPLDVTTQLFLDGTWTDITADTYQRDSIQIVRGRADETSSAEPSSCAVTLDNRSGDYSPRNPVGAHYGVLGRNTAMRVLTPTTEQNYLALSGSASPLTTRADASTPDAAALDITGDIDIRVLVDPLTWRPPGDGYGLAQKYLTGSTFSRSWVFWLTPDGYLSLRWTPDGTPGAAITVVSTVSIDSDSPRLAVRVTVDVDNGAAGHDVKFYTDTNINGGFTQLGATVTTAGVTSIFAGSADLEVGRAVPDAAEVLLQGRVYAAQVRNGIGGSLVASPDFTTADSGQTAFSDAQGNVWTLQGRAVLANPGARFHGEVSAWPQKWDMTGSDVYTPVQASGILRRLGQGAAALKSVMYRTLTALDDVVAYWPCEDGSDATELASALPGYPAMIQSGEATNGTYDGFKASDPLPTPSESHWVGWVPPYTPTGYTQARFLLAVPAAGIAGTTTGAFRLRSSGTAPRWDFDVTAAGSLSLQIFDADDVLLVTSGVIASAVNGRRLLVSIELDHTTSTIGWDVRIVDVDQAYDEDAAPVVDTFSGTVASRTFDRVIRVGVNLSEDMPDAAFGHISIQTDLTTLANGDLFTLQAYAGELATGRVLRLCQEESVPVTIMGDSSDATRMGPQLSATLLDLLREAADADLGILFEPREFLGLAYRTRAALYAQSAAVSLDYPTSVLASIEPTEDDQDTRNDVTVERVGGSSARAELTTGALSVNPPPDGVGRYDEAVTISVFRDADLPNEAGWRLWLGTVDEARYPVLGMNLASPAFRSDAALTLDAEGLDVGDLLAVTNPPAWLPPDEIAQLAQGFTETLGQYAWLIDVNCSPGSPWAVGVWDDDDNDPGPGAYQSRYSSDGTTLSAAVPTSGSGLVLNAVSPGRASTPDAAVLDIVGDIDVRVHLAMTDWTPTATQILVGKTVSSGNQISWRLGVTSTGLLRMTWTTAGVSAINADSTVAPSVANGAALWVRATLDVDNGAAGRTIRFYTGTDGQTWTQLGADVVQAGVTSIFSGTAEVAVSGLNNGTANQLAGTVSAAEIRSGIDGTVVANPDFGAQPAGTTSFVDGAGRTWTVNSPAVIAAVADALFPEGVPVSTPLGPVWSAVDAPFDIAIGGERMTVTAVAGTGAAQVFTVTRSVNGVRKAHASGAAVELFQPAIYAL